MTEPEKKLRDQFTKATVHITVLENGVIVCRFDSLARAVLVQFIDYLQIHLAEFGDSLRVLIDFRGAGYPSRYMIDRLPRVISELNLPTDTRFACLIGDGSTAHFLHTALRNWIEVVPALHEFLNYDPALNWLLGHEDNN